MKVLKHIHFLIFWLRYVVCSLTSYSVVVVVVIQPFIKLLFVSFFLDVFWRFWTFLRSYTIRKGLTRGWHGDDTGMTRGCHGMTRGWHGDDTGMTQGWHRANMAGDYISQSQSKFILVLFPLEDQREKNFLWGTKRKKKSSKSQFFR